MPQFTEDELNEIMKYEIPEDKLDRDPMYQMKKKMTKMRCKIKSKSSLTVSKKKNLLLSNVIMLRLWLTRIIITIAHNLTAQY